MLTAAPNVQDTVYVADHARELSGDCDAQMGEGKQDSHMPGMGTYPSLLQARVRPRFPVRPPLRWVASAVVLAAGITTGTRAWSQSASELYERALVAYNQADIRTAYVHLENALAKDPTLLSALLLLGKIHLTLGNGAEAQEQLAAAGRLGADRSLTRIPLAQAYLMQGKAERVVSELFPSGMDPWDDAGILALRGQAYLDLGNLYEAERSFDQAWERAPDSVPALLGRVQTRIMRGALDEALADSRRAVELDSGNARALYSKATVERKLGQLESALVDLEEAIEVEPTYLPAQIGRIGVLVDLGRIDDAVAANAQLRKNLPQEPRLVYLEAVLALYQGDRVRAGQALQEVDNLLAKLPGELIEGHAPTLLLAGLVAFNLKKWEQAGEYLGLYHKRHPEETGPRKLLARLLLERNHIESAIAMLEPALPIAPEDPDLLSLLADAYARNGLYLKASGLLDRALSADSGDLKLQTQQAITTYALGQPGKAISQLGAVLTLQPDYEGAGATLVVMLLRQRQYQRAVEIADALVRRHPRNPTYLNLDGVAHLLTGDNANAQSSFGKVLEVEPDFVPARLNLAKLELAEGKAPEAQARLEALIGEIPNHAGAMLELARVFKAQGHTEEALQWAKNAVDADPTMATASVYLTELLLESGEPDRAVEVAEAIELRAQGDVETLTAVARTYLTGDRRSSAQVILQRASGQAGYDARKLLQIADLQQQAGDLEGAAWSLQKAVEGEPGFVPSRIRFAEVLISLDRMEKAEQVAAALRRDFPDEPFGYHLQGIVEQRRGNLAAALHGYQEALERQPDSAVLAIRVYQVRRLLGGNEDALSFLEQWVKGHSGTPLARQALADGYAHSGRWKEAQALYEQVQGEANANPLLSNNLALVYQRVDDPRALVYARRAYNEQPNSPQIADTLGWILVRTGKPGEGLRYLRDAQSRAADDPGIRYHIGVALTDLGRRPEALRELEKAVRSGADFFEREEAQVMLEQLRSIGGD